MACDPNVLLEQAKCLNACVPQGMMPAVNVALLCNIVSGGAVPVFPSGLIHYWSLNELSGSIRVDSIGGVNMPESGGAQASTIGINGHAILLTNPGQVLSSINVEISSAFSVAVWIKVNGVGGANVGLGSTAFISITAAGSVLAIAADDSDGTMASSVATGSFHLIVMTSGGSGGAQTLFIDGAVVDTGIINTADPDATINLNYVSASGESLMR
jgi:hypothetical protein